MDGFAKELKYLVKEVLALKTGYPKTATALSTKETNIALTFELFLPPVPPKNYADSATQHITLTANENMIAQIYLNPTDDAQDYNTAARYVNIKPRKVGSDTIFDIYIHSRNEGDTSKLLSGQRVFVTYSFKIVGTSDYTMGTS